MARKVGRVMARTGTYMKGDEVKNRWKECGVLLETDNGLRIKLEMMPVARPQDDGLWLSVWEDEDKPQQQGGFREKTSPAASQTASADPQDDIPF